MNSLTFRQLPTIAKVAVGMTFLQAWMWLEQRKRPLSAVLTSWEGDWIR
jgi:hypothetical protein